MNDFPFDVDFVIRKANLRGRGVNGMASLALAMMDKGYDVHLLKRTAIMACYQRVGSDVEYVKESDEYMLRYNDTVFNLYLDMDWQQSLERFHRKAAKRGDEKHGWVDRNAMRSTFLSSEKTVNKM